MTVSIRRPMFELLDQPSTLSGPILPLAGPAPCQICWVQRGWIVAPGQMPAGVDEWVGDPAGRAIPCPHGGTS